MHMKYLPESITLCHAHVRFFHVARLFSTIDTELDSGDDYQMNNLDSDDETCPTG